MFRFQTRRARTLVTALLAGAAVFGSLVCGASAATAATKTTPLAKLQTTLRKDLTDTTTQGGALVFDERTGSVLFADNAATERLPASVEKLYTTSTALLDFGANARLSTRVYGVGTLSANGTWNGTIYLRGGGDPTFGAQGFDNMMYGTGVGATVQQLANNLRSRGIRRIDGRILGDESYFDSLRGGPDTYYQANLETEGELSALAYDDGFTNSNENALQPHPVLTATRAFAAALRRAGVAMPKIRLGWGHTPATAGLLTSIASPPMSTLVSLTNSPSDNFFAETLLKDLGARFGAGGTTAAGAAVVRSTIASKLGLYPTLADGSGLSRADATSPDQIVWILRDMQSNAAFYDSLAIAGVSGTMQDEMLGTRAAGNCRGKTGTLHDVANLVGYCRARNGDQLVFAFMMNGLPYDSTYAHEVEDKMGIALANYNG